MHVRRILGFSSVVCFATLLTCLSIVVQTYRSYDPFILSAKDVQPVETAMILGASIQPDGRPSDALKDRMETGIALYKTGKVRKLLITGDDGGFRSNEVATMQRLAIDAGVPEEHITVDGHGYRTYESCKRAVSVFGIKTMIVVTQRFHLSRALYLCSKLGIKAQGEMNVQGVPADLQTYERIVFFTVRDWAATLKAWWDINILPPKSPVNY